METIVSVAGGLVISSFIYASIIPAYITPAEFYGLGSVTAALAEICGPDGCGDEAGLIEKEFGITTHALERMYERGVSIEQLQQTLHSKHFLYFHNGVWKDGYYDNTTKIFVASYNGIITTIINNIKPQYIENLRKVFP